MASNEPDPTPAEHHDRPHRRRGAVAELAAAAPGVARRYGRLVSATARNAAEVVRFGGLETGEQPAPFTVEAEQSNYRLRHYFADGPNDSEDSDGAAATDGPPVLLVPPLMMATEVWDVAPSTSAVVSLHAAGVDPWVVDFGDPGHEPGGLDRTLTDHVLAVSDAVDRVHAATGRDVVLAGYSQGGMFAYQTAALRRGEHIDSLVTFGSPADTTAPLPIPISPEVAARLATGLVESGLLRKLAAAQVGHPAWASCCCRRPRPCRAGCSSCSPCTTATRCCPGSASAASSTPRAGRPTPGRPSPSCWSSSWPTTGCSRAASSSTTGW